MGLLDVIADTLTSDFVQNKKPGFLGFKKAPKIDPRFLARGDMIGRAKELQKQYAPEHLGGPTPEQQNLFRGVAEEESFQKQYQQQGIKGLTGTGKEAKLPQFYDPGELVSPSTQAPSRDFSTLQVARQPETAGIQSMVQPENIPAEPKPAYLDEEDDELSQAQGAINKSSDIIDKIGVHESRGGGNESYSTVNQTSNAIGRYQMTPIFFEEWQRRAPDKKYASQFTHNDLLNNPRLQDRVAQEMKDIILSQGEKVGYHGLSPEEYVAGYWVGGPNFHKKLQASTAPGSRETVYDYIQAVMNLQ